MSRLVFFSSRASSFSVSALQLHALQSITEHTSSLRINELLLVEASLLSFLRRMTNRDVWSFRCTFPVLELGLIVTFEFPEDLSLRYNRYLPLSGSALFSSPESTSANLVMEFHLTKCSQQPRAQIQFVAESLTKQDFALQKSKLTALKRLNEITFVRACVKERMESTWMKNLCESFSQFR